MRETTKKKQSMVRIRVGLQCQTAQLHFAQITPLCAKGPTITPLAIAAVQQGPAGTKISADDNHCPRQRQQQQAKAKAPEANMTLCENLEMY
jgi:hypothetical protein